MAYTYLKKSLNFSRFRPKFFHFHCLHFYQFRLDLLGQESGNQSYSCCAETEQAPLQFVVWRAVGLDQPHCRHGQAPPAILPGHQTKVKPL